MTMHDDYDDRKDLSHEIRMATRQMPFENLFAMHGAHRDDDDDVTKDLPYEFRVAGDCTDQLSYDIRLTFHDAHDDDEQLSHVRCVSKAKQIRMPESMEL